VLAEYPLALSLDIREVKLNNSRLFWALHDKLMRLIDEQTTALLKKKDITYEQTRLDILSLIPKLREAINGAVKNVSKSIEKMSDDEVENLFDNKPYNDD